MITRPSTATEPNPEKKHMCAICRRQGYDDVEGGLVQGMKIDPMGGPLRPWRGYVCDMHLEEFARYRFV